MTEQVPGKVSGIITSFKEVSILAGRRVNELVHLGGGERAPLPRVSHKADIVFSLLFILLEGDSLRTLEELVFGGE